MISSIDHKFLALTLSPKPSEGVALVWESYKLDPYVQRLAEMVVMFQEKVDDLLAIEEAIEIDLR